MLLRVARGDEEAFERLYDLLIRPLFGVVRRIVRDPAQSEEVVQEVMVELWRSAPRYSPARGSALTWALTLAHRCLAALTELQRESVLLAYYGGAHLPGGRRAARHPARHGQDPAAGRADPPAGLSRVGPMSPGSNAAVHALTGAYVLHAVTGEERAEFERHLAECVVCRQEVAELRDTATRLGLAAAVLLVAAIVLGVTLIRERQDLNETRQRAEEVTSILRAGDARVVSLDGGDNGRMTVLLSRSQNRILLLADGLPDPPAGRDLQVWKLGSTTESAGILTPAGGRVALSISGTATQLAVTVEPDGGSDQPTTTPILAVDLPA